jgi:hypothetical protein
MLRRFVNWLNRPVGRRPRYARRRYRPAGCLLWLLILIGVLVVLSLFFGSFQKGTRAGGFPAARPTLVAPAQVTAAP